GKQNASLYFAGTFLPSPLNSTTSSTELYRTAQLLYFDPHYPQKAISSVPTVPHPPFHTHHVRALSLKKLDPSMLLGFVFFTQQDADDFLTRVQAWQQGALFYILEHPPGIYDHGWKETTG
ncbi:hypothetical protein HMI55_001244, partial [Coelomomyces lativittatus]